MKSMKSKSSKRKDRNRSPPDDGKCKRSKVDKKDKGKDETTAGAPRKSRWQAVEAIDTSKNAPAPDNTKPEKSGPPLRIKDLLHDKEKIVDLLFQAVTGTALQELIPDYLQKRSQDDLKKLCLEEIKLLSDDIILQIISGKSVPDTKGVMKLEKEQNIKTEKPDVAQEKKSQSKIPEKKPEEGSSLDASDTASNDVLELHTTAVEMESILDEENQIPLVIKDEVAKDLITPERDAELLELEMRARAIRSLLRAKSQLQQEESLREAKDGKELNVPKEV